MISWNLFALPLPEAFPDVEAVEVLEAPVVLPWPGAITLTCCTPFWFNSLAITVALAKELPHVEPEDFFAVVVDFDLGRKDIL